MISQCVLHKQANTIPIELYPPDPIKKIYDHVLRSNPDFKDYFPDYYEEYCPQRRFFWTMYLTVLPEKAEAELEKARKMRLSKMDEREDHVWMEPKFFDAYKEYYG